MFYKISDGECKTVGKDIERVQKNALKTILGPSYVYVWGLSSPTLLMVLGVMSKGWQIIYSVSVGNKYKGWFKLQWTNLKSM